ncbi:chitinase [Ceratobasidium sp. AG-Ba]|nr:chitinase [Ceratobasidium sp. AG-Ba]QRV99381.1 chitinase [Ceratobasidium sp. AG-Ba]QRW13886.1 chitinase [Ceratobasidium sp. AG-Ba]
MRSKFAFCFVAGAASSALAWPGLAHHAQLARRQSVPVNTTKAPVAATWFASWHANDFPLANVSWHKYSVVTYSFALTTPDVNVVNITDPDVFKDFVSTAHANATAISVGGWTGSQYFSSAVATAENRTAFVKTLTNLVQENNLDGLDFDWEYPNSDGIGCNTKSPNDTANFLSFLQELRDALPDISFSAATSIVPFMSADGTPSTDVSGFASLLDYIAIMNYDVWGAWSDTVGPNAPLNDTCAPPANQVGSAVSAVQAWTAAGIPADQLVFGVASYGHSFEVAPAAAVSSNSSSTLVPYPTFNKTATPKGDAWDTVPEPGAVDVCGNPETVGGNWDFWGLIAGGFLNENGTANTAEGILYRYDECSQTPYVYNQTSQIMVSYDDATSFAAKGQFIKSMGLRGFAMWEAGGDYDDILLDSIRAAAGFPEVDDDDGQCGAEPTTTGSLLPTPTQTGSATATETDTSGPTETNPSTTTGTGLLPDPNEGVENCEDD